MRVIKLDKETEEAELSALQEECSQKFASLRTDVINNTFRAANELEEYKKNCFSKEGGYN